MTEEKSQNQQARPTSALRKIILALVVAALMAGGLTGMVVIIAVTGKNSSDIQSCQSPDVAGVSAPDSDASVPGKYKAEQIKNAKLIDAAASKLGLPGKASQIAITTAMGESSLLNLDHGDEGAGVKNPDGSATTSKGLFQQQTSTGWGTAAQVTDPEYSATSFFTGPKHNGAAPSLVSVPGWESKEMTAVIHQVQGNADPNHYASSYAEADKIIKEAGIDISRPGDEAKQASWRKAKAPEGDKAKDGGDEATAAGDECGGETGKSGNGKDTYPWPKKAPDPHTFIIDPMNFYYNECTSYSSWKVNEAMGGTKAKIVFNNSYGGNTKGDAAGWKQAWEDSGWKVSKSPKAGTVAWWGAYGSPGVGAPGHVGWVDEVLPGGYIMLSEYNNTTFAPPGHKYARHKVKASEVNAFLHVPGK